MDGAEDGYARFHDRRCIVHGRVNKVGEVQMHRYSIRNSTPPSRLRVPTRTDIDNFDIAVIVVRNQERVETGSTYGRGF